MTKKKKDVHPSTSGERSPLKDLTNTTMDVSANITKGKNVQSWYARLSDEKKAEYNAKRRISRQQKKIASLDCASVNQLSENTISPLGVIQCTPLSDITTSHTIGQRSPLKDLTNTTMDVSANITKGKNVQSWYARLSDEKKAEHNAKRRISRQQKKIASLDCASVNQLSENTISPLGVMQCTPLSHITNSHTIGTCATSTAQISANTPSTHASAGSSGNKRGGKGWYASLTDEQKADHLRKLRMAREEKRVAAHVPQSSMQQDQHGSAHSGVTRIQDMPSGNTNMEEDGSADWLHTNSSYKRIVRSMDDVPTSFISGRSNEITDAFFDNERLRKRTKYSDMGAEQKFVVLSRNRAYKSVSFF